MNPAVLDTDIFSEVLKGKDPTVKLHTEQYRSEVGELCISVITVLEIVKGFQKRKMLAPLTEFRSIAQGLIILNLDANDADLAGVILAKLENSGQTIGRADPMIAATAINRDRTIISGNTKHYERIKNLGFNLSLDNWRLR